MVSINLFEDPTIHLEHEAKRRKILLMCLVGIWLVIMGSLITGAYILKDAKEKRSHVLIQKIEHLKPRMAHYQHIQHKQEHKQKSQCAAYRLKALFETPIKGLHLSSLTVKDHWEIEGYADFSQALEEYKRLIETNLDSSEWTEQFSQEVLSFTMKGKIAC